MLIEVFFFKPSDEYVFTKVSLFNLIIIALQRVTLRQIRPRMQSNCVQKAIQMGLDRESIRIVVQNRIRVSRQY